RSGERDLVDVGMRHEGSARVAVAGDDVDDTGRQADLAAQLREAERRQWRVLGGLQDNGVTGGDGRRDLPREHEQREMPRVYLVCFGEMLQLVELVHQSLPPPGMVEALECNDRQVYDERLEQSLAVIERLENR